VFGVTEFVIEENKYC